MPTEIPDITSFKRNNPNLVTGSSPERSSTRLTRRGKIAVAGALGAGLAAAIAFGSADKPTVEAPQPEIGTYNVKPGDTLSGVAQKVAENTPGEQELEETMDQIVALNPDEHLTKDSGLTAGMDTLNLPVAADANPDKPGIQLNPPK